MSTTGGDVAPPPPAYGEGEGSNTTINFNSSNNSNSNNNSSSSQPPQQQPQQREMTVFIRTLTGQTLEMRVRPSDTVLDLKRKLQANHSIGVAPEHQRLIYQGYELRDDDAITGGGRPVVDQGIVHIVLRKPEHVQHQQPQPQQPGQVQQPARFPMQPGHMGQAQYDPYGGAAQWQNANNANNVNNANNNAALRVRMPSVVSYQIWCRRMFVVYAILGAFALLFFFSSLDIFLLFASVIFFTAASFAKRASEADMSQVRTFAFRYWQGLRALALMYFVVLTIDAATTQEEGAEEERSKSTQVITAIFASLFITFMLFGGCIYHASRSFRELSGIANYDRNRNGNLGNPGGGQQLVVIRQANANNNNINQFGGLQQQQQQQQQFPAQQPIVLGQQQQHQQHGRMAF